MSVLKVALTGGIGTGKSYVLARFHDLHLPTIDSDHLVHAALEAGSDAVRAIEARFGPAVVASDGRVDRRKLGAIVFGDLSARRDLEAILHPLVYAAIREWFERLSSDPACWAGVAEIPLLYETGREPAFDAVIVAACEPDLQVRRAMARDDTPEAEARRRLAAQWPIDQKVQRGDYVIWTGGSFEETDRQVVAVYEQLRGRSR